MPEHLTREEISALLDEPWPEGRAHLEGCEPCRHEYEEMSRMRMAISALGEMEPPAGEWERIAARLGSGSAGAPPARGAGRPAGRGGGHFGRALAAVPWPLQAAAVLALFAAGIVVGRAAFGEGESRLVGGDRPGLATPAAGRGAEGAGVAGSALDPEQAYLRAVASLAELGAAHGAEGAWRDPETAALELARLDAVRDALSDALQQAPTDPVLNNLLFEVAEERSTLSQRMAETFQLAELEYR